MTRLVLFFAAVIAAAALLIPALNVLTPPEFVLHVPDHLIPLFGKYLCFAILALALALDLAWG